MCRCNFYKNCGFINNFRVHSLSLEICQRKNTDKYFFPDIGKLLNQIEKATGSYFFFFFFVERSLSANRTIQIVRLLVPWTSLLDISGKAR